MVSLRNWEGWDRRGLACAVFSVGTDDEYPTAVPLRKCFHRNRSALGGYVPTQPWQATVPENRLP